MNQELQKLEKKVAEQAEQISKHHKQIRLQDENRGICIRYYEDILRHKQDEIDMLGAKNERLLTRNSELEQRIAIFTSNGNTLPIDLIK